MKTFFFRLKKNFFFNKRTISIIKESIYGRIKRKNCILLRIGVVEWLEITADNGI